MPHATAGVAIIETGAGSDDDLVDTLERLLPRDDRYRHAHGSPGHGADHVMPALVAPSVTVPVQGGEPLLGTWQSVVLVDLNRDNPRRSVRLSFIIKALDYLAPSAAPVRCLSSTASKTGTVVRSR